VIGAFKTVSTKSINELQDVVGVKFWQRDFYEHVIRNERELNAIRQYIINNPANWREDKLNPGSLPNQFNQNW
jgi:putative transposase